MSKFYRNSWLQSIKEMEADEGAQTIEDNRNMSRQVSAMNIEISWYWTVFGRNC